MGANAKKGHHTKQMQLKDKTLSLEILQHIDNIHKHVSLYLCLHCDFTYILQSPVSMPFKKSTGICAYLITFSGRK